MSQAFKLLMSLMIAFAGTVAHGEVDWNEPEVVPEKLVRKNRRVLRFSGQAEPGTLIRIRRNQVKMYLDNGRTRWARIPQKHRVQFPVEVDSGGMFNFDLYLPIVAVEIPIQVKEKGDAWRAASLNFRVPDKGKADNFELIEQSFQDQADQGSELDKADGYYSRKNDRGLVIGDREGRDAYEDSKVKVWGGLGVSYFFNDVDGRDSIGGVNNYESSGGALVVPTFRFGADWSYADHLMFKFALRSSSGSTDSISGANIAGTDFNWLEFQATGLWFAEFMQWFDRGRLALDMGLQLQQLPFFRQRDGFVNLTYFDVNTYNLSIGAYYYGPKKKVWNYEIYGRYLFPIVSGDGFDIESTIPLMFEFGGGVTRPISAGLDMGIFAQLNYFSQTVSYQQTSFTVESDMNLMLLTVDVRLMADF